MLRIPFGAGEGETKAAAVAPRLPHQVQGMQSDLGGTEPELDDDELVMGRPQGRRSAPPSCFDIFAGLWVLLYERYIPSAHRDAQQAYLVDELNATTSRLRSRRDDLQARVRAHAIDAKRSLSRGDKRGFQSRMASARRLRLQVHCVQANAPPRAGMWPG